VTYNHEHPAKITDKVGYENIRARKDIFPENEPADKRGQPALHRVAGEIYYTYFQPESTGHIHRAWVAAVRAYVLFLEMRYKYGEVETADKITDYRAENKPIPTFGKSDFRHFNF
jgi:hypothetical protein